MQVNKLLIITGSIFWGKTSKIDLDVISFSTSKEVELKSINNSGLVWTPVSINSLESGKIFTFVPNSNKADFALKSLLNSIWVTL